MLFPFNRKITQNTRKIISIHIFTSNHFHSSHNTFWALSQQRTPHSNTSSHTHSSQRTPHTLLTAPPTVRRAQNANPRWVSFPFLSPDPTHDEWVSISQSQSDPQWVSFSVRSTHFRPTHLRSTHLRPKLDLRSTFPQTHLAKIHGESVSQSDPHASNQNLTSDPHSLKPINNPTSYPPSRIRSIYIYIFIYLFVCLFIYLFI